METKKLLAVGIILLFVGTCLVPATAQNIEKSLLTSRGNWLYVGGSGPGNYTTIQDAVDNASEGDTVFVFDDSSPYVENIVVNTSLSLIGEKKETTIINGSTIGSNDPAYQAGLVVRRHFGWAGHVPLQCGFRRSTSLSKD